MSNNDLHEKDAIEKPGNLVADAAIENWSYSKDGRTGRGITPLKAFEAWRDGK